VLVAAQLNLSGSLKFLPCDPDQHREPQRIHPKMSDFILLSAASAESAVDVVSLRFLRAYPCLLWLIWSGEMPRNMLGHSWQCQNGEPAGFNPKGILLRFAWKSTKENSQIIAHKKNSIISYAYIIHIF